MTTKEELKIYEVSNEMKKYFDKCFRKMLRGDWMNCPYCNLEMYPFEDSYYCPFCDIIFYKEDKILGKEI